MSIHVAKIKLNKSRLRICSALLRGLCKHECCTNLREAHSLQAGISVHSLKETHFHTNLECD